MAATPATAHERYLPGMRGRLAHLSIVLVTLLGLFVGPWWYAHGGGASPELGTSFSCRQVEYLGDNCLDAFTALAGSLGVRHFRVSLYWSQVEPSPGRYDFSEADALLALATEHGADIVFTLGIKAQRYPEAYVPAWAYDLTQAPEDAVLDHLPRVHDAALAYVTASVSHFAASDAVAGWQVENEPFIKNFDEAHGWTVSPAMTAQEVAAVHAGDPRHRPVVVTHSAWTIYDQAWKRALIAGDVLGENVFTKKAWIASWSYFFPYEVGPFDPDLPGQASAARRAGKQFWITELQAEPEEKAGLRGLDARMAHSISPSLLRDNLELARRSHATRVYLWGAEWWYHERQRGDSSMWQAVAQLIPALPQ